MPEKFSKFLPKIIYKMKNTLEQRGAEIFRYISNATIIAKLAKHYDINICKP